MSLQGIKEELQLYIIKLNQKGKIIKLNLADIISKIEKPKIYEKGTAFMWTDEHISKQLLNVHLNPDIDLGSRKKSTIEKTANWILDNHQMETFVI